MSALSLNEYRCLCGKLLLKGIFFDGILEIKCKRCGRINKIGRSKTIEGISHYLLFLNNQGLIINASDSACNILGYNYAELSGKIFTEIDRTIPKEIMRMIDVLLGQEAASVEDSYFQLDTIHRAKDNRNIPVLTRLKLHQPLSEEKCILVSTEIKNADKKIFEKNETRFLNNICDFCFDMDVKGMGEYASESVEKIFGFPQEMIVGRNFFESLPAEVRVEYKKIFDYFVEREQPFRLLNSAGQDMRGQPINVDMYFTSKFSDNGKFIGYCVLGWLLKNQ